jgi:predicted transcriptional regulator
MRYWWVLLVIALFLFIPGLFFLGIGVSMWDDEPVKDDPATEEDESDDPQAVACMTWTLCVPLFWLPSLVLFVLAFMAQKESSVLSHTADLMHAHDRITVKEAAVALEVSEGTAKKRMSKCIKKGLVSGRIKNDTYYSPGYLQVADRNLRRREYLIDMSDILKAYRRVSISDFAERVGMSEDKAERVMLECMEDGLVYGYISRRSKVFFTREYLDQIDDVQIGWECENCGSHNQEILLPGEIDRCPYCGSMSRAKGTKQRYIAEELDLTL